MPEDLQYSLIEFIAHVNAEDYDAMPADFVNLVYHVGINVLFDDTCIM